MSCDAACVFVDGAALPPGFCARWYSTSVRGARGLAISPDGEVLAVARSASPPAVLSLRDDDGDGSAEVHTLIASASGLNHGLAVRDGFLYASSDTTVYRWPYVPGGTAAGGEGEVVVRNINADGRGGAPRGHWTRTLVFDAEGALYVSVGSADNIDLDSHRSRIRRLDLSGGVPEGGFDFATAEVFADGLRNEVGMAFDRRGVLWGVENSADQLYREDLGGSIVEDNPAEELNMFTKAGKNYGYPFCFTEFSLPQSISSKGRGTVWAWPSTMNDGTHDDGWCRDNTSPPVMAMQAHSAPLGIAFFDATRDTGPDCADGGAIGGAFPDWMDGDAFVAFHGSWNRAVPTGYKVVRIPMGDDGMPSADQPVDFFRHCGAGAKWPSGLRPVDVKFDRCNRLLISSDGTRNIGGDGVIVVGYRATTDDRYRGTANTTDDGIMADACCVDGNGIRGVPNRAAVIGLAVAVSLAIMAILGFVVYNRKAGKGPHPDDEVPVESEEKAETDGAQKTDRTEEGAAPSISTTPADAAI